MRSSIAAKDRLMRGAVERLLAALEDDELLPECRGSAPEKAADAMDDWFAAVQASAEAALALKGRQVQSLTLQLEAEAVQSQQLREQLATAEERSELADAKARSSAGLVEELSSEVALLQESLAERMTVLGNSQEKEQMLESDLRQVLSEVRLHQLSNSHM